MKHEAKKASARNHARLAASSNGGRTMTHKAVKKGNLKDADEMAEGLQEYLQKQVGVSR